MADTTTTSQPKHSRLADDVVALAGPLIRRHYRRIGVMPGWNVARFRRLCAMLNVTPVELGLLVAVEKHDILKMIKKNQFSPTVSLHFTIIDAAVREQRIGRVMKPVIPFMALSGKSPE